MLFKNEHTIQIDIPGKPIPKARPAFSRKTGRAYNPQREKEMTTEEWIHYSLCNLENFKLFPVGVALVVQMLCIFPRPKNHFGTGRNKGILKKSAPLFHLAKPDTDNLEKYYLDCMNERAYKDDNHIIFLEGYKMYSNNPDQITGLTRLLVTPITIEEYNLLQAEILKHFSLDLDEV